MISLSCTETRWSICAMRELIIISASRAMVIEPSRNCADEFLDQVAAALFGGGFLAEPAFFDDLVEEADFSSYLFLEQPPVACWQLLVVQPLDPPSSISLLQLIQLFRIGRPLRGAASSSLSLPWRLPRRSDSRVRRSSNCLRGGTCARLSQARSPPYS